MTPIDDSVNDRQQANKRIYWFAIAITGLVPFLIYPFLSIDGSLTH